MSWRVFILLSSGIIFFACNSANNKEIVIPDHYNFKRKKEPHKLAILPFRGAGNSLTGELKTGLQKRLAAEISVFDVMDLPSFAFYKPRQRYIADSLLVFLDEVKPDSFEKIIGITNKDISTRKPPHENWGILGLGSCPGESSVISSFRAGKSKVPHRVFIQRMITLALHEIGHTYGLEHCPVASCLMKDAEGKMNLDNGDDYCKGCRNYLSGLGLLK